MKKKQTTTDLDARVKELLASARELPPITDEEKEELAWKGPFEPIPFDIQAKPEAELSDKYDIFAMIRGYENEAREILKAGGYPLTVKELVKTPQKERRIRDIMNMLTHFREVRIYIGMNDAAGAALSMAYGIRSAMLARIRPVEPFIDKGKAMIRGASLGGITKKKKDDARHETWQAEADAIWRKHPSYKKWRVAGMLAERYAQSRKLRAKQDSISRVIKNPA
jgi:hypothetical protein